MKSVKKDLVVSCRKKHYEKEPKRSKSGEFSKDPEKFARAFKIFAEALAVLLSAVVGAFLVLRF